VYAGGFAIDIVLALALARPEALGIEGAAIAQAATLTVSAIARLMLVRRFLGIWPFDAGYLRLVPAAAAGGVVMAFVHAVMPAEGWLLDLLASFGAGSAAYVVALVAFGLPVHERTTLLRMVRKVLAGSRAAA
jgi:O-antigen/teichoic acid export membrane protein